MHRIGDIVRLIRGWTPMCVIGIDNDGDIIARYCHYSHYPIVKRNYEKPTEDYDYIRPQEGFVVWDGKPLTLKVLRPMPQSYRTTHGHTEFGTFLNKTSNGEIVLEMANGAVKVFNPGEVEENIPFTFEVKSMTTHHYKCHYSLPDGITVQKNEILLSDSGNAYVVVRTNTKNRSPKGVFKGTRLVQQSLL